MRATDARLSGVAHGNVLTRLYLATSSRQGDVMPKLAEALASATRWPTSEPTNPRTTAHEIVAITSAAIAVHCRAPTGRAVVKPL